MMHFPQGFRRGGLVAVAAAALLLGCLRGGRAQGPVYVWWEGEAPVATNFPKQSAFSASTFPQTRHLLSGGDWLGNSGPRRGPEAFATYRVDVPAAGEYHLWSRKFWKHGPFRWRFGTGEWQTVGPDVALADDTFLRQFLNANWVYLGKTKLAKGPTTFELRLLAGEGEELTAAFDAFLLIQGPFMPNGALKPGQRSGQADPGFFPYEPPLDPFRTDAALDLRSLNETAAGEKGFVRRDGARFLLGSGQPVRFWGVNVGPNNISQSRESVDYLARRLAKLGVNAVRFHGPLWDQTGPDPARLDPKALDDLFYLVAALRREGIYLTLSYYFPLWFDVRPQFGIAGYETIQNKKPFALLYFDPRLQQIYRSWTRQLLTTRNPYTGRTLAAEPAVGTIELLNEDSFFFWTFTKANVPAVQWERLEARYGEWLRGRYGSLEKAFAAWGRERQPTDNAAAGRAALYEAFHMTRGGLGQGGPDKQRRMGDQVRFLTELQRRFYAETTKYIRDDLKAGSMVAASNWMVTDPALLDALERYTYTAGEVIDRHGYFGGTHEGDGASYSVRVGHTYADSAGVTAPEALPLQFFQVEGYPQIISEIGWTTPNRYRADATFLAAAYGGLQAVDGFYWFAVGSNFLRDNSLAKFPVSAPVVAGTFPATALLYRRGDVAAASAITEFLRLDDLYALRGSSGAAASALDELRRRDLPPGAEVAGPVRGFDPLSFYAGSVTRGLGDPAKSRQANLAAAIDRARKTVRSLTGELTWDWGNGLARIDTARSQGAAGFLSKAGRIDLGDVSLECRNDYGAVLAVSLDGQPLAASRRVLVQAMTEEQPYGFKVAGNRITDLGGAPFGVRRIDARVTLKRAGSGSKVAALDENGYATPKPVRAAAAPGGAIAIDLAPDALYHVITRP